MSKYNEEYLVKVDQDSDLYKYMVATGRINDGDEVSEYIDEDEIILDDEFVSRDFALLLGAAVAVVGIVCITVGVAFVLSMGQTVGWM